MTAGNGGEGEGKLAGEVRLAGMGWFVGGELPIVSVATAQLRRAPGDGSVHDTEGKKGAVSAVSDVVAEEGKRGRGERWHDGIVLDLNLGSGGKLQGGSSSPAAIPPSWRCTVLVEWRGELVASGVEWCGRIGARGGRVL